MEASERIRAHIWVNGLVQGVNYRAFVRDEAKRLCVGGWVRNLPDGRVELEIEGEKGPVEAMIMSLRKGPPLAMVDDLDIEWHPADADYHDFQIRM